MSIQSEIDRITNNVNTTLNTIAETGLEVGQGSDALPAAASALANEKAPKIHDHEASEVTFEDGDTLQDKFDAGDLGGSGEIYYGSGEPPAEAKVQIDPNGTEVFDVYTKDEVNSKKSSFSITLLSTEWVDNFQTVTATGITTDNDVIICPNPSSFVAYGENVIRCSAQSTDILAFVCENTPAVDITVNVMILN